MIEELDEVIESVGGIWGEINQISIFTLIIPAIAPVYRLLRRIWRNSEPTNKSPWSAKYWRSEMNRRVEEKVAHPGQKMTRRVDIAVAQIDANEALRWGSVPGTVSTWVLSVATYMAGIFLFMMSPRISYTWVVIVLVPALLLFAILLQIEAIAVSDKRKDLQSILARMGYSENGDSTIVIDDPQGVIRQWDRCRGKLIKSGRCGDMKYGGDRPEMLNASGGLTYSVTNDKAERSGGGYLVTLRRWGNQSVRYLGYQLGAGRPEMVEIVEHMQNELKERDDSRQRIKRLRRYESVIDQELAKRERLKSVKKD